MVAFEGCRPLVVGWCGCWQRAEVEESFVILSSEEQSVPPTPEENDDLMDVVEYCADIDGDGGGFEENREAHSLDKCKNGIKNDMAEYFCGTVVKRYEITIGHMYQELYRSRYRANTPKAKRAEDYRLQLKYPSEQISIRLVKRILDQYGIKNYKRQAKLFVTTFLSC